MNSDERCIFCGSKNIKMKLARFVPFLEERMFLSKPKETYAVHCNHCKFWFSSYRPNNEEMARLYTGYRDEAYQKQRQKYEPDYTKEFNFNLGHNPEYVIYRKNRLETLVKKHLAPEKITKVLDYGGDNGQFIPNCFSNAEKFVYEVSNVPTIEGVKNISEGSIIKNHDFDFIMCCHVLEHVDYPIEIIKKLYSYCKNDGYIYLEVPCESIPFANNYIHEHISVFSDRTFLALWMLNGIDIIETKTDLKIIYALIRKRKVSTIIKHYKKVVAVINLKIEEYYRKCTNLIKRLRTIYYIMK